MMSPDAIAALVMQMKPPIEIRNSSEVMRWRLKRAVYLTMQSIMDEMMPQIGTTKGRYWK